MRKNICGVLGLVVLFGVLCALGWTKAASAAVQVNINLGPPPIRVAEPPEIVMIPGVRVYFVPGLEFDVFFYNGYWWSPRGDRWYRSGRYNGPWGIVQRSYVPGPLFKVPRNYRAVYKNERPINYGQFKKQHGSNEGGQPQKQGREKNKGRGGKH